MTGNPYFVIGIISLFIGLAAGFVMHRSDFCLAGMFRDFFLFRRTDMLRSFVLLVLTSMVLFEVARQAGLLSVPFPLLYPPTAANLIGGGLFGVGMVLAGGCVVGTLYKMGSGSVLSMVAFAGIIFGSGLYAEMHPLWAGFIRKTTSFPGKITVSQILGVDPLVPVICVAVPAAILTGYWFRRDLMTRNSYAAGYLQPYKAAVLLSVISAVSYVLIGMPMGVTSLYTKMAALADSTLFKGHFEGLSFYGNMPLNYFHSLTGSLLKGGPGPRYDALAAIQLPLVAGIVAGSAISATLLGEFRIYYRLPVRQFLSAAAGGIMMGLASRMAPTCNVWHMLGGLPILAASSILFLIGILPGAWLGGRIFARLHANGGRAGGKTHGGNL